METQPNERYVSEKDLRLALGAELAQLELRLVNRFSELVTKAEHDLLASRVAVIEAHGSPQAQDIAKVLGVHETKIETLESLKNRVLGAIAVLALAVGTLGTTVAQHYL